MTRPRAGRTAAVCVSVVLLAGCGKSQPPREQVQAACEKYVTAKAKADHLRSVEFVAERVAIGAVRTRATMEGTIEAGRVPHEFLCTVERKHGDWGLVIVIWRT